MGSGPRWFFKLRIFFSFLLPFNSKQLFLVLIPPSCFQGGRLGLGTEEDVCTPKEVKMNKRGGGGGVNINDDHDVEFDDNNPVMFAGEAEHR